MLILYLKKSWITYRISGNYALCFSILAEKAEQKNLENQALNLSLKYSFVTPMTSMVVTKPEAEEVANKPTEEGKNPHISFYVQYKHSNRLLAIPLSSEFQSVAGRMTGTMFLRISVSAARMNVWFWNKSNMACESIGIVSLMFTLNTVYIFQVLIDYHETGLRFSSIIFYFLRGF